MAEAENNDSAAEVSYSEYVEDGKNKMVVKCKYCNSKMLEKKCANYVSQEKELPLILQEARKEGKELNCEKLCDFYHVENMYTFDNIGFTHTVGNTKYLSCADCDTGPVGYYDMDTKHSFVALSRILHA